MADVEPILLDRMREARSVAVLTGAGGSKESGVPTFRDKDGLWAKFDPSELASVDGFLANPGLVWRWYTYRREIIRGVSPNPGHRALVAMENRFEEFTLITQNVDNLHRRAGSRRVYELHGNIERNFCIRCRRLADEKVLAATDKNKVPTCSECGGMIRPDVVWFGEMLPEDVLKASFEASQNCDLFFSIGTSAVVYPAAGIPIMAKQNGAYLVEINVQETDLTPLADSFLKGPSGEVLPKLCHALWGECPELEKED